MPKMRLLIDVEIETDKTVTELLHYAQKLVQSEFELVNVLTLETENLEYKDIDITKI